jgi:Holliday junction DNA helicase RuvB
MKFDDIIGNDDIKLQLFITGRAAITNNTSVPHTLFTGAPGCGKTTMSKALALDIGSNLIKIPSESLKTAKDVVDLADALDWTGYNKEGQIVERVRPTVVFFDEVHKMPLGGQEVLGIAMEEWYVAHKNTYTGRVEEIAMPRFTVIGATTMAGKLSKPFRDRFKLTFQFSTYSLEESIGIAKKHASLKNINITDDGALAIAQRSRGTPRIIVGYIERGFDAMTVMRAPALSKNVIESVFSLMRIDYTGLTGTDIKLMTTLYEAGVPVGIDTLAIILNESPYTVQNGIEPYLIQRGLILRTGRGRTLTQAGIKYLADNKYIEITRRFKSG